jgi:hypothetical protein
MFTSKVSKTQTEAAASPTNSLVRHRSMHLGRPLDRGAVEPGMFQWGAGNQAGQLGLLESPRSRDWKETGAAPAQETEMMDTPDRAGAASWSGDFSKIPLFPPEQGR